MIRARIVTHVLLAVLAALVGGCSASSRVLAPPPSARQPAWNYLSDSSVALVVALPAPVDHVDVRVREFETRLTELLRDGAVPAMASASLANEVDSVWEFAPVMGPNFTLDLCPTIAAVMQRAAADANRVKNLAKDRFTRSRPDTAADAGADYRPDQPARSEAFSYPSGHATRAAMWAVVLTRLEPERERDLLREAWFVGLCRMTRGVHFPTDVTAGFILGRSIGQALLESPAFQRDLEAARAEWIKIQ